jgi:hypothetical protein
MTIMQSCDHHDAGRCVPDNRSRERILEQFALAIDFGDAFLEMVRGSDLHIQVLAAGAPTLQPTITISMAKFLTAWVHYVRWQANQPRGDDLAPPVRPPAEIRVPDLEGEPIGE